MLDAQNNINFYTKFSNVNLLSNKDYLKNAYANHIGQEAKTDEVDISRKLSKKTKKILAASFIGATAITLGAIALKTLGHKTPVNLNELINKSKKGFEEAHLDEKFSNTMGNTINVKDDLWDKFSQKTKNIPILNSINKVGNWITSVYKKGLSTALGPKYDKYVQELKKLGYEGDLPTFDRWFESVNAQMYERFHAKGQRVTDGLFNKDIIKTMSASNIADGKITDILEKELIKTPQNATPEMINAIDELNKVKGTLLPKMRDINCGSAPTDLLTVIISTLGLGAATITADNNEERKSILANLGIPLLATLGSTTYGTMKALAGPKSLVFGLIAGQIASGGAKAVDKFVIQKNIKNTDAQ